MEMSVVLVVIAIITGMGVSMGVDVLDSSRRSATEQRLDVIEQSLLAFREKHGRLPCPGSPTLVTTDANFGIEAANGGTCTGGTPAALVTVDSALVPYGAVPVRTLGLSNEMMLDGWGRKIHYEVTPAMTADHAFLNSQVGDNCSLTVVDHSGGNLPHLPVYALVSYGKNGIGGYLPGGTQQTGGTIGTVEQTNVRSGITSPTTAPTIQIKNGVIGSINTTGYYDDLVRFKARYQMMDDNDRMTPPYKGPELVLSYNTSSGVQMVYGKRTCGEYKAFSGTVPSVVAAVPQFMAFTPGNSHLFAYHTNNCKFYQISGTTLTAVSSGTPVPNCPAAATVGAMAQGNGMLVLNTTASPYLRIYRMVGTGSAATFVELANPLFPALTTAAPNNVSLSENGEYLAVSRVNAHKAIYVRHGDYYTALNTSTQPDNASTVYSNAISPNGKYYASAVVSGGDTQLSIYRNLNGVYSLVGSAVTLTGLTAPTIISFSPDSLYIAVGGTSTTNEIYVVNINPATEALSTALSLDLTPPPVAAAFSNDSRFLAVARATTGTSSMAIFRRSGTTFNTTADTSSPSFTFNGSDNSNFIALSR